MKKFASFTAVALAAALSLTACGDAPDAENSATPSGDTSSAAPTSDFKACMVSDEGGFDDKSFNETSYRGLTRAVEELGVQKAEAESNADTMFTPNVNSMVSAGCNLVFNVGFKLADTTATAAAANPETHFALIDSELAEPLDNVKPILFNTQEAAYLAGYAAAGFSKTGTVATFGGMQIPSVAIFMDGFVDGVAKYNEDNGKSVKVLGWDKAKQDGSFTGDFSDISKGKSFAEQFIAQGADVIMPVAGPVGEGAMQAAQAAGNAYIVGVDDDSFVKYPQYGDIILTSVLKAMDQAVFDTVDAAKGGAWSAEAYVGTLSNGGVSLAGFNKLDGEVPGEVKEALQTLQAEIAAGSLVVESPNLPVKK